MSAVVVILSAFLWDFFRKGDFAVSALGGLALMCIVVLAPGAMVYTGFRRTQSVCLDEEGVSVEMLSFSADAAILPKFRRVLLRWEEVNEISTRANVISLHGSRLVVRINTFYFDDVGNVFSLIERHCRPPISKGA